MIDVLLNGVSGLISWAVNGNELRIGWNSLTALNLAANEQMISLKLKTTAAFTGNQSIQFTLAADPLNELANAQYDVIGNAVLSMEVVEATLLNIEEAITTNNGLTLSNHPNPFNGSTMITYELPFDGKVTLELYNYLGSRVSGLVNEDQSNGHHSFRLDASSLAAGIYMAKLTVKNGKNEVVRTIKLVNHK